MTPKAEGVSPARRLVAFCGKGGSGKTALTALMTRVLLESGKKSKMLLIDADPVSCLPGAVGAKPNKTVAEVREEIINQARRARSDQDKTELANMLDYVLLDALTEWQGFSLLVMGRQEGPGCFCPVNLLLREAIEVLAQAFELVLIDGEAGIEQINRRVTGAVDTSVIVTDPTTRGVQAAALIGKVMQSGSAVKCKTTALVINRVKGDETAVRKIAQAAGLQILGCIPEDDAVAQYDLIGKPLTGLPDSASSVIAVRHIVEQLNLA
jgi:CO dehydrogenase maturation factor